MRLTIKTLNTKLRGLTFLLSLIALMTLKANNPQVQWTQTKTTGFASQQMSLLKAGVNKWMSDKCALSLPLTNVIKSGFWAPENCSNGLDDDGDGYIDGADPDCGCAQTIMLVARDDGNILSVNLATGGTSSVATSSPYVTGNLNALAANANNNIVYYCRDQKVYYWIPSSGTHGLVADLAGQIGSSESLSSGGGEYYAGYLYLGTEKGNPGNDCRIWRLQLSANGKSAVGAPVNLNVPIPNQLSWGDIIATAEGGQTILYCMAAAGTSYFFKYNVNTAKYTLIRSDLPTEMQLGVDITGNTWAGSLSSGMIQKINRTNGYFYGNTITFGGKIWDLTGPINCPQSVEICGNGIDDDADGYTDNQDQDCLCPTITANDATSRTICEGDNVSFNVNTNAPKPPYSYIEYYRFNTVQTNPYLSTDAKVWLGEVANNNGTGIVTSNNFPNTTTTNTIYYVYGVLKPAPQFPASCAPKIAYTITVKPSATLNAGSDVAICAGASATLNASATNAPTPLTYTWSNGLGTGASKTVTPTATTTYTVTVTAGNGCTTTDQVVVTLNPKPTVNAGADVSICTSGSTTLTATASSGVGPYTYAWSNGLGSGAVKTVAPTATTTYTVTVTGSNGCIATDQVKVTVTTCVENCTNGIDDDGDGLVDCADSNCGITVTSDSYFNACAGSPVTMTVSAAGGSGVFSYAWSHGLGTGASKTVTPLITTNYTVTVTPTVGCTATKTIQVVVTSCPEDCSNGIDDDFDGLVDCDDPDCALVGAPVLEDDSYSTCPGTTYAERVTYNDGNMHNPTFSIFSFPNQGNVTIDGTGKFTYTPVGQFCGVDAFAYEVCNQTTGCCSQATVTIQFGDTVPPIMLNVPADVTINCDDEVPPPDEVLAYDHCPGIYLDYSENTDQYVVGACESFTITRLWKATDLCGNVTTADQVITVQDLTGPEIQRLYTLANGKELISGNATLTSERWKYVSFPLTFGTLPVVFAQLVTENETQAATVQLRNISTQGFEVKIMEQEDSDGTHLPETVAWLAIEKGMDMNSEFGLEVSTLPNATSVLSDLNFGLSFSSTPALIASIQTVNEVDAATPRFQSITGSGAQVFLDEESSRDAETTHSAEKLGYLALTPGEGISDENGEIIGETGTISLSNTWVNVPLKRHYTKPIVIMGGATMNDGDPVTIRVKEAASNSFNARLQEWTYQDGSHGVEQVSYFVVEGAIPADPAYYCEGSGANLLVNQTVFARDNCDDQLNFGYTEHQQMQANGMLTSRTWVAVDDCGKSTIASRNDTCIIAAVRLKVLLHGAYFGNFGSNLMRDDLRTKGFIPTQEPYSGLSGFQHKGKGGGEQLQPALLQVTGPNAIVDWVFVEIRDSVVSSNVLETRSALLQRDGDVVSADGSDVLLFPTLQEGDYYVALRHRNHIGIMTDATLRLTSSIPPLVDFTDINKGVKGWNEAGILTGGKRMLWAGDLSGNRQVIYQGPYNDVFFLFSKILSDPLNTYTLANFITTGYERTDLNMDGRVVYQGPGNDRANILSLTILAHPNNPHYLANFIVREYLP